MTASVVVLGEGQPRIADHLRVLGAEVAGQARDAIELASVLGHVDGDVLLVDAGADCSGVYPIDDVRSAGGSRVLVGAGGSAQVRVASATVVSAGTSQAPLHDHQDRAGGFLQIAAADRGSLDQAIADLPIGPPGAMWEQLLSLLVMRSVAIGAIDAAPFEIGPDDVGRAADPVGLQARRCARGGDGWLSERTVRRMSRAVTPLAVRWGLAPNTITVISLIAGAAAVGAALSGSRWGYLATSLLMVVSLVLDCVDGEVARWTHRYSTSGAWLDAVGDRVKEYGVWFAVAVAVSQDAFWALVVACLILFTTKHFLDYGWSLRHPPWRPTQVPITDAPDPWYRQGSVPPSVRPPSWRRILGMPIAERWLLIAVLLPVAGPWPAFGVLAVFGALSLAYTVATRIRWSHSPISPVMVARLQAITDPGLLLLWLRPARSGWGAAAAAGLAVMLGAATSGADRGWLLLVGFAVSLGFFALAYGSGPRGRLGWMAPAVARVAEMVSLMAVAWFFGDPRWVAVFVLLAAGAWRQYDVIYRIRNQQVLPDRAAWLLLLGAEGRVLAALVLLLAFGVTAWLWLGVYVAVVALADSAWSWFGR